jgi:phosphatidylserine/phosphatidylglycerophosphate/cardiolipin synthase-like enzyme
LIIFDDEIMEASADLMRSTKDELTIIFYTISPYKNTNPVRYRAWWIALMQTAKRLRQTRVILSGWHPTNPQMLATLQAAIQLREVGALVKIGSPNMIIHPKAMCFDDKILLNGSHNATEAGFTRTKNVSITTTDELAIGRFMDYFQNRWDSIN